MRTLLAIISLVMASNRTTIASPEADMLRAHYPHGVHKLRTDKAGEKITWDSEVQAGGDVKRETRTFANLDAFKAAFTNQALNKAAYIEIAGMWHDKPARKERQ